MKEDEEKSRGWFVSNQVQLHLQDFWNCLDQPHNRRAVELAMQAIHNVRLELYADQMERYRESAYVPNRVTSGVPSSLPSDLLVAPVKPDEPDE